VYTRGFPHTTSKVLEENTTDHHPVLTTIKSGGGQKHLIKINRRNFKAICREALKAALSQHEWLGIYSIKDVEEVHKFVVNGIITALDVLAYVEHCPIWHSWTFCPVRAHLALLDYKRGVPVARPREEVWEAETEKTRKHDKYL
jgi:hypothetical protein